MVEKQLQREKLLQIVSPELNEYVSAKLEEKFNIHSFDITLKGIEKEGGIHVIFRYGDGFAHQMDHFFPYTAISAESVEIKEFTESAGETCKDVMISDYYKMMDL